MSNAAKAMEKAGGTVRNRFGAFPGVFTPCLLTILGVILFMRANFVVGQAGILGAILILLLAKAISLFTALSASAIATNMQVRGGGAYYLISRVLGPEFGGAIGIVLYLAQGVSVPFYVLGFTEALVQTIEPLKPHYNAIAFGTAAVLLVVTYVGAGWAIRLQYVIMGILALAILSFMSGALLRFSPETLTENLHGGYTALPAGRQGGDYSFWMVFAIYFPAVTGIMAGLNMSGDLDNPARAIPRGTLAAIGVAFLVYLAQILICGGAFSREALTERPYLVIKEHALFGGGLVVAAGMFAATLSSAIGSFMGAPRVLQAVSRDRILPTLRPFAKGARKGDEPRRAIVFTGVLTFAVLAWAARTSGGHALNLVAQVITMFFLCTYGMLNVAAFIEAWGENPSFRPRFRLFHWTTALAGGAGCVVVAFIIHPPSATVAVSILAALVWWIRRRELSGTFGDARRGFLYKAVRTSLLRLAEMKDTPRNWRPTSLAFVGNPEPRDALVNYAVWLEAGRGIVFLVNILEGPLDEYGRFRDTARRQLEDFCAKRNIHAFPVVVVDEDLERAMACVMQATSIGPVHPKIALFGWSQQINRVASSLRQYQLAHSLEMGVVIINEGTEEFRHGPKRVDIWWRGRKNGGLMVLLAHLLAHNWEWAHTEVRLLRVIENEAGRVSTLEDLDRLLHEARVNATAQVIVSDRDFVEILHEESADSDCVFLGFEPPDEGAETDWHRRTQAMLSERATTILVCAVDGQDLIT